MDLPLIDDSFFLNMWLLDHDAATAFQKREKTTNKKGSIYRPGKPNEIEKWQVGMRIEIPPRYIFLWRNDIVHSGCYAGRDLIQPHSREYASVHVGIESDNEGEGKHCTSFCERMHCYLPTTPAWIADLKERSPSTYGTQLTFTPFDGTLSTSKKRNEEVQLGKFNNTVPVMASYLFWPSGESCGQVPRSSKTPVENRTKMFHNASKRWR